MWFRHLIKEFNRKQKEIEKQLYKIRESKEGYGVYYYKSGEKYEGEFKYDKKNGFGKYYYTDDDDDEEEEDEKKKKKMKKTNNVDDNEEEENKQEIVRNQKTNEADDDE